MKILSNKEWWGDMRETYEDRPRSWEFGFEAGGDCMPEGWYAEGLNAVGFKITSPVYHEYGPFDTEAEAKAHAALVDALFEAEGRA